jgi:hypothetical protein
MKFSMMIFFLTQAALAAPQVIISPVDHLYVPEGFDSNDSVELVVSGTFPNTCYRRNDVEVKVVDEVVEIKVTALAPDSSLKGGRSCPDLNVPFKEVISVGNLQGGKYSIVVNRGSKYELTHSLKVMESSSSAIDDHVYAAIDWVESKGNGEYALHGWKYSNCYELDQVQIVSNKSDTFSVLPIMKQLSDSCPMKGMPIVYPVKLDFSSLKTKKPLIHIRTMDGKSVNSIIDLER